MRKKNKIDSGKIRDVSMDGSPVRILIASTNEELEIARQCFTLLSEGIENK